MNYNILVDPGQSVKLKNGKVLKVDRVIIRTDGIFYQNRQSNNLFTASQFDLPAQKDLPTQHVTKDLESKQRRGSKK
jgi:hypothetical protein